MMVWVWAHGRPKAPFSKKLEKNVSSVWARKALRVYGDTQSPVENGLGRENFARSCKKRTILMLDYLFIHLFSSLFIWDLGDSEISGNVPWPYKYILLTVSCVEYRYWMWVQWFKMLFLLIPLLCVNVRLCEKKLLFVTYFLQSPVAWGWD